MTIAATVQARIASLLTRGVSYRDAVAFGDTATLDPVSGLVLAEQLPGGVGSGPALNNLVSWSIDPNIAIAAGASGLTGRLLAAKIPWTGPDQISKIWTHLHTAGSGLTTGQNLMALFSGDGATRLAGSITPDQTTAWAGTGVRSASLTAPIQVDTDPLGYIYAVALCVGTTPPVFSGSGVAAALANLGLSSGDPQAFGVDPSTGQSVIPSSIDPDDIVTTTSNWFVGVSR